MLGESKIDHAHNRTTPAQSDLTFDQVLDSMSPREIRARM